MNALSLFAKTFEMSFILVYINEIGRNSEGLEAELDLGMRAMKEEFEPEGIKPDEWKK